MPSSACDDHGAVDTASYSNHAITATGLPLSGSPQSAFADVFSVEAAGHWNFHSFPTRRSSDLDSVKAVYTVTVTDEHGATATQDVTITVTGTNDAPVISSAVKIGRAHV